MYCSPSANKLLEKRARRVMAHHNISIHSFRRHKEHTNMYLKTTFIMRLLLGVMCFILNSANAESVSSKQYLSRHEVADRGLCEIEIINDGHVDLQVYGILDNGVSLKPFKILAHEYAQYVDLYDYNHVCHEGMNLYILTFQGNSVYSAYTKANSTIHLVPVLMTDLK